MKTQIGVIGFYGDIKYRKSLEKIAERIGRLIAKNNAILVVGGEKDAGIILAVMRSAKKCGGAVVGVVRKKCNASKFCDVIIQTGGLKGLREYILAISCDVLIGIGGGSGTLNEITVAYQNDIPIVLLKNSGGWSDKLVGKHLDRRRRYRFAYGCSPEDAVKKAIKLAKKYHRNGKL
jgi:hypothetical protein